MCFKADCAPQIVKIKFLLANLICYLLFSQFYVSYALDGQVTRLWSMRDAETMLTEAQKLPLMCYNLNACIVFWVMHLNMSRHICVYHPNHTTDNDISLSARDVYESWPPYYTRTARFSFCQHKLNSTPALAASLRSCLLRQTFSLHIPPPLGKRASSPSLFSSLLILFHSQCLLSFYQKKMRVVLAHGCHRTLLCCC